MSWTTHLHTEEVIGMQLFAEVDEQGFPPDEDNDDDKDDDEAETIRWWGSRWLWRQSEVPTREGRSCTATCPGAFPTGGPPLSFRVFCLELDFCIISVATLSTSARDRCSLQARHSQIGSPTYWGLYHENDLLKRITSSCWRYSSFIRSQNLISNRQTV